MSKAIRHANYLTEIAVSVDNLNRAFRQNGLTTEVQFQKGSPRNGVSHKVLAGTTNFFTSNKLREVALVLQAARRTLDFAKAEVDRTQEQRRALVGRGIEQDRAEEVRLRARREIATRERGEATHVPDTHPHFPESGFPAN